MIHVLTDLLSNPGNTGLGKETILQLAQHSPSKIFLASRTESKALEAIASIKDSLKDSSIGLQYVPLDLASFKSIRSAAEKVNSTTDRLDILICNAGVMGLPPDKTEQGHEIHLGTNHVGHHLLTKLLLPTLEKTAALPDSDVRIISVSSFANEMAPSMAVQLDTEKLCATGGWTRYGASKAANILFAAELARRYPALTSVSVHPGFIKSDLWNSTNKNNTLMRFTILLASPFIFQAVGTGAHNQLWAAAGAKKEELQNGEYYTPMGKSSSWSGGGKRARDVEAGKKLWEWTEEEIMKTG